jgi:hypothetical protein
MKTKSDECVPRKVFVHICTDKPEWSHVWHACGYVAGVSSVSVVQEAGKPAMVRLDILASEANVDVFKSDEGEE